MWRWAQRQPTSFGSCCRVASRSSPSAWSSASPQQRAATRVLGTLVFGVSHADPVTFAGAGLLLALIALVAHYVPIRRALRIDPAAALRQE